MKKSIINHQSIKNKKFGFTFIEILVVATIIGLLTTIATVTYQSAQKKARDGKRKADFEQIRSALEMYRADSVAGIYPATLASLTTSYIQSLPSPPPKSTTDGSTTMTSYETGYTCTGSFKTYSLCMWLEVDNGEYCVANP